MAGTCLFIKSRNTSDPPGEVILAPPKSLNHRLMERSAGVDSCDPVTGPAAQQCVHDFAARKTFQMRRSMFFCGKDISWRAALQARLMSEVDYVMKAYGKTRAEAAYALLLHEAIENHNVQLAQKLQEFGELTSKISSKSSRTSLIPAFALAR